MSEILTTILVEGVLTFLIGAGILAGSCWALFELFAHPILLAALLFSAVSYTIGYIIREEYW